MPKKKAKFEWDKYNVIKNWEKHQVRPFEVEETFLDKYALVLDDDIHSNLEKRYILIGRTRKNRILYSAFIVRNGRIRVISARDANKKEVKIYEKETGNS